MGRSYVKLEETKWHKRGFASKAEYLGWLQFNDLVDETFCYDDTYHDQYTGKTVSINKDDDGNPIDADSEDEEPLWEPEED